MRFWRISADLAHGFITSVWLLFNDFRWLYVEYCEQVFNEIRLTSPLERDSRGLLAICFVCLKLVSWYILDCSQCFHKLATVSPRKILLSDCTAISFGPSLIAFVLTMKRRAGTLRRGDRAKVSDQQAVVQRAHNKRSPRSTNAH